MNKWYLNEATQTYYHVSVIDGKEGMANSLTVSRVDRGEKRTKTAFSEVVSATVEQAFLDSDCTKLHKNAVPKKVRRRL